MKNRELILSLCGAVVLFGAVLWLVAHPRRSAPPPAVRQSEPVSPSPANSAPGPSPTGSKPAPSAEAVAASRLTDFADQLQHAATPAEAQQVLDAIRSYLGALPKPVATNVLQHYLQAGGDVATRLQFQIGPEHDLKAAPTLRVWLLDCLALVDRTAAAEMARTILGSSPSPDEWAISLRDFALARTGAEDVAFVQAKMRELLANDAWRRAPSAGFLEAFDTLVYTHASSFTPDLAGLLRDTGNRAVAHAAYLTLDRLVLQDPAPVLSQLQAHPELMQGREKTRANYFARGDVRDPQQRSLVESYLLDPVRSSDELWSFAGLYPSANFMVSNNLLTAVSTPTGEELAARDRDALKTVEEWLADPRFTSLQPQLRQLQTRLHGFVDAQGK